VQRLQFSKQADFNAWAKANHSERIHLGIPASPHSTYRGEGWSGWGAFLGKQPAKPPEPPVSSQVAQGVTCWCTSHDVNPVGWSSADLASWNATPVHKGVVQDRQGTGRGTTWTVKWEGYAKSAVHVGKDFSTAPPDPSDPRAPRAPPWMIYQACSHQVRNKLSGMVTSRASFVKWCHDNGEERSR
jgi:hypothetical protein